MAAAASASALDQALAKLDQLLLKATSSSPPAAGAAVKPVPSGASDLSAATPSSTPSSSRPGTAPAQAAAGGREVLATKAQIKVARITSAVKQPNSEKLLKLQADLGEGDARQIMAGLQQFFTDPAVLVGRLVCVASNLKPAKLAGEPSQAMVLAAEAAQPGGQLSVLPLVPPEGACPGDLVHLDGCTPPAAYPKVLKLDEWRAVLPGLLVKGGKATFEGTPLVTAQGLVTVPGCPDGAEIH